MKKLSLNKTIITQLQDDELHNLKGGMYEVGPLPTDGPDELWGSRVACNTNANNNFWGCKASNSCVRGALIALNCEKAHAVPPWDTSLIVVQPELPVLEIGEAKHSRMLC